MNKENNKKKKFNKKYLLFGLPILALGLVVALTYYAVFSTTVSVHQPVSFSDTLEQTITDCTSGETCLGDAITISNDGENPRTVSIVETSGSEDIEVKYVGILELTKKDTTSWEPIVDSEIELTYTVVGEEFEYSGVPIGYTLIYYKDGVVGLEGRLENPQPAIVITSSIGDLPQSDDANLNADYSQAPDGYEHKVGAKLWAVPTEAILEGNVLDWSLMSEFYYETDLIFSFANANELTVLGNDFIEFYPTFTPNTYVDSGDYTFEFEFQ